MIAWNILGWMLVIILGIICLPICLPIFIALLCGLGYILFLTVIGIIAVICVIIESLFDKIKSLFNKIKSKITKEL